MIKIHLFYDEHVFISKLKWLLLFDTYLLNAVKKHQYKESHFLSCYRKPCELYI